MARAGGRQQGGGGTAAEADTAGTAAAACPACSACSARAGAPVACAPELHEARAAALVCLTLHRLPALDLAPRALVHCGRARGVACRVGPACHAGIQPSWAQPCSWDAAWATTAPRSPCAGSSSSPMAAAAAPRQQQHPHAPPPIPHPPPTRVVDRHHRRHVVLAGHPALAPHGVVKHLLAGVHPDLRGRRRGVGGGWQHGRPRGQLSNDMQQPAGCRRGCRVSVLPFALGCQMPSRAAPRAHRLAAAAGGGLLVRRQRVAGGARGDVAVLPPRAQRLGLARQRLVGGGRHLVGGVGAHHRAATGIGHRRSRAAAAAAGCSTTGCGPAADYRAPCAQYRDSETVRSAGRLRSRPLWVRPSPSPHAPPPYSCCSRCCWSWRC